MSWGKILVPLEEYIPPMQPPLWLCLQESSFWVPLPVQTAPPLLVRLCGVTAFPADIESLDTEIIILIIMYLWWCFPFQSRRWWAPTSFPPCGASWYDKLSKISRSFLRLLRSYYHWSRIGDTIEEWRSSNSDHMELSMSLVLSLMAVLVFFFIDFENDLASHKRVWPSLVPGAPNPLHFQLCTNFRIKIWDDLKLS